MITRFAALTMSALALSLTAHAQWSGSYDPRYGSNAGMPGVDESFLEQEMNIVSAEIEWSEIAHAKTANDNVKSLSRQTISEDTQVAQHLVTEAKAKNLKIPNGLSDKYKKESAKLNGLTGDQFDKEYVSALIKVQHDDVGIMREEAKVSKSPSLVDFATRTGDQVTARNDFAKTIEKMPPIR